MCVCVCAFVLAVLSVSFLKDLLGRLVEQARDHFSRGSIYGCVRSDMPLCYLLLIKKIPRL